jgi:DNA-binding response OmpR family regulator
MTILIVDDDAGIRELLFIFLTFNGYDAVGVANGAAALAYLQQAPALPHLILLDLTMPVMDGVAFRHAQQQDAHLMCIPVVVMSAVADVLAPQLTAEAYLPKPIDFDVLLPLVEQYCHQSQQRGSKHHRAVPPGLTEGGPW